uniref:uroporphyrinogen-III C-methyltransferase n=1 Tax=Sciadococcus taiwanensis TaxID=3028030 RepID=A0A9Y1I236_9RHOD|nr:urophorphyrin III methylase [Sciadococcus taiwanensis]
MNINNKKLGKVYLIGAGPGDPELLTLKAKRLIEISDVVIYDALVNPCILNFCHPKAELIKVGKRKGKHTYSQSQISELLIEKSLNSLHIVRLKGGDPCIFGRGGEEMLDLSTYGITVEIIPGITTAMASAAYTNFPLTHRKVSSSVSFVTGAEANNKAIFCLKWENIILGSDTIVIYMALHNLSWIIHKFIQVGRSLETPIILIQWCSLPKQRTLIGTLGTIIDQIYEINFGPPSIAIIGEVVEISSILPNIYKT